MFSRASSVHLYLHITSFVLHPSLIDVLCLTASLNKQYNRSSPVLIPLPLSPDFAGASLSVITPLKLESGVIVLSVTTVALWKGVIVWT